MHHLVVFLVAMLGFVGACGWSYVDDTPGPIFGYAVGFLIGFIWRGGPDIRTADDVT